MGFCPCRVSVRVIVFGGGIRRGSGGGIRARKAGGTETKRESRLTCNYSTLQLQPPSTFCYNISLIAGIATDSFAVCGGELAAELAGNSGGLAFNASVSGTAPYSNVSIHNLQ
jgi:hypothetical protein